MYRNADNGAHSIYRVTVEFAYMWSDTHTRRISEHYGHARLNVKASTPTAAREFVLSHPDEASLPGFRNATVLNTYKLKRQPVWLRKAGKRGARFDTRELWLGHIESSPLGVRLTTRRTAYSRFNYNPYQR